MYVDGEEFRELEASITKVRKSCRYVNYGCKVLLAIVFLGWIVLLGLQFASIAAGQADPSSYKEILYAFVYGLILVLLLLSGVRSFSAVVKGESPFTVNQVKRFRFAALLLILLTVVDATMSVGFSYDFTIAGVNAAAVGGGGADRIVTDIDLMPLFFAAILYGVSILFRYGVLLQRLTDETE